MKDRISRKWIDRIAYSRDASIYRLFPEAVARPSNENEIISLFQHIQRENTSVTFRTAGTSLSGQSVTNGIIAEVVRDWKNITVLENGAKLKLEPGVIGDDANKILNPYHRKIGPDPASIKAAMIGGIVSNNASGMCCGITQNSYHTLEYIRFILPNGNVYDTSNPEDYDRFNQIEKQLSDGLIHIKNKINANQDIKNKILHKYRIKNTIGYSLNAILDWKHPIDIFAHLLVGSEGTLAFISNVTLKTVPDPVNKATGLLLFNSIHEACNFIPFLKENETNAVELMDYASLTTAKYLKDSPYSVSDLTKDSVALLCEYQSENDEALSDIVTKTEYQLTKSQVDMMGGFYTDKETREKLWSVRKNLYPTVGSLRKTGTSVITEDIAFDTIYLGDAIMDLQKYCKKWHFDDTVIFGHAKDGNLHFVSSIDLSDNNGLQNYEGLMHDIVDMTVGKYDGSLKAEHGTGRNMAPFVEMEWGSELTKIMWEIKSLIDPDNRLNPGVLLSKDEDIHVKNLKTIPTVSETIDLCIECGFCEKVCPSKELTLTPRQRIILARERLNEHIPDNQKQDEQYYCEETCATDGLCEIECPINIDTGMFIKELRHTHHSSLTKWMALWSVKHFSFIQKIIRIFLHIMRIKTTLVGHQFFIRLSKILHLITSRSTPIWNKYIPKASQSIKTSNNSKNTKYVYFTTCINRVFSPSKDSKNLSNILFDISKKVGILLTLPDNISDLCCGMPYSSKGYKEAENEMIKKTIDQLYIETEKGKLPILIDTSACTYQLMNTTPMNDNLQRKWQALTFVDIVSFLLHCVEQMSLPKLDRSIILHPTCSTRKMNLSESLKELAEICAKRVIIPEEESCCGFAGDRGLLIPELTDHATKKIAESLNDINNDVNGYSTSRTCEIGMMSATDRNYESIAILVKEYLFQN